MKNVILAKMVILVTMISVVMILGNCTCDLDKVTPQGVVGGGQGRNGDEGEKRDSKTVNECY